MPVSRIGGLKREVTVKVRNCDAEEEEETIATYCAKVKCDQVFGLAPGEIAAIFRESRAPLAAHRGEGRHTWVSVMRIEDVAIVGVPYELFTQLGVDIKRRSPFRHTFVAGLATDWLGYVGNAEAYRLGGYQMWMRLHSWTEHGTGELFVHEAVNLLDELYVQHGHARRAKAAPPILSGTRCSRRQRVCCCD